MAEFAERLQARQQPGSAARGSEIRPDVIRQQLEVELLTRWEAGDQLGIALRADASRLLQAVHGVEAALEAATADVKGTLAQRLAEVQAQQALQLALQTEQLDLQRQQLVNTNLILQRQQEGAGGPRPKRHVAETIGERPAEELPPADMPCP